MVFDQLIYKDLILDNINALNSEDAIKTMAELLLKKGFVEEPFIEAILEREQHYPSGLPMEGHKIAIPHTDATYVKKSALVFARLKDYVTFHVMGSPDETIKVRLISMFALREKKEIGDLLETLITMYQNNSLLDSIIKARNSNEIYTILRKEIEKFIK